VAVQADWLHHLRRSQIGLFVGKGPNCAGQLFFDGLGIPPPPSDIGPPVAERMLDASIGRLLPRRARTAHKGDTARPSSWAVVLACRRGAPRGRGMLRAGAGLVTIATRTANGRGHRRSRPNSSAMA